MQSDLFKCVIISRELFFPLLTIILTKISAQMFSTKSAVPYILTELSNIKAILFGVNSHLSALTHNNVPVIGVRLVNVSRISSPLPVIKSML